MMTFICSLKHNKRINNAHRPWYLKNCQGDAFIRYIKIYLVQTATVLIIFHRTTILILFWLKYIFTYNENVGWSRNHRDFKIFNLYETKWYVGTKFGNVKFIFFFHRSELNNWIAEMFLLVIHKRGETHLSVLFLSLKSGLSPLCMHSWKVSYLNCFLQMETFECFKILGEVGIKCRASFSCPLPASPDCDFKFDGA